ncbi:unnamed protein product, partial [Brassica napus]
DVGKRSLGWSCDQLDMQTSGDFGLQHSLNESDNEVNKHMAYLLRALPHVLAAFSPPSDSSHPEEDQEFSWVRPDNIYFNERSGDCGPSWSNFLKCMQRDTPMRIWGRSMTKRWTYSVRNTRWIPMKNLLETQKFKTMVEDVYTACFISFVKPNC